MTEQEVIEAAGLVYQRKQIDEFLGLIPTLSAPDGLPLRFEISVKTHRGDYLAAGRDKHIQVSSLIAISAFREIQKFIGERLAQMGIEPGQEPEPARQDVFGLELDELNLSVRSANCLKSDNVVCIGDLVQKSEYELLRVPNFGHRSLNEVKEVLAKMGLRLAEAEAPVQRRA